MDITIRKAVREDVTLLFEFIKGIADFEKLGDAVKSSPQILEKTIFDSGLPIEAIFALVDGVEVAFAIYYFNFSTFTGKPGLFLEDLFVKPEYRKKGIGKKMMDYLIDEAKRQGCGRMEWTALKWNPACDFYEEQFGAEPLDEWTIYRLTFQMKRVVVGISGGVDSSVAAWKLRQEGYDVVGLFMRNWHDTTGLLQSECHWEDDLMFAELTAKKLNIPFHFVDLSDEYRKRVVDYMFAEYEKGRTPNPDVLCNREIKFDTFAKEARKLGGDFVATGHYCQKQTEIVDGKPMYRLLAGVDTNKDQSYFLCQLSQEQLAYALFPIGNLTKPEVRRIAAEQQLATAQRKDSQGICFVGKVDLPTFLQQKLKAKDGDTIEIPIESKVPEMITGLPDNNITDETLKSLTSPLNYNREEGKVIGSHRGSHFFTIGQRKGINIGGYKEPLFVLETDVKNNILFVGEGHSHPGLNRKGLFIANEEIHYISVDKRVKDEESRDYQVRVRYRQSLQKARLYKRANGLYILFEESQRGITPGQFAAWYDGKELIGSGVIGTAI